MAAATNINNTAPAANNTIEMSPRSSMHSNDSEVDLYVNKRPPVKSPTADDIITIDRQNSSSTIQSIGNTPHHLRSVSLPYAQQNIRSSNSKLSLRPQRGSTRLMSTLDDELAGGEDPDLANLDKPRPATSTLWEAREKWDKKADFLLSVIGFAVDLANVWRFPYLCYRNGGGAFLIPYSIFLAIGGFPLFYLELTLGQYNRKGAITCWGRLAPLFKGVGWSVVLIAFYVDFFYNVILSWALYFFFASFAETVPWATCDNEWNTPSCLAAGEIVPKVDVVDNNTAGRASVFGGGATTAATVLLGNITTNATVAKVRSAAEEYFYFNVMQLDQATGIDNIGYIKWRNVVCLALIYLICYFSLWKGVSTSGKVVWFTALFPYVALAALLVRGVTLEGSMEGIEYYLTPDLNKLKEPSVWVDAATQVFFSMGPGFGVLMAYASYNEFHNNVYHDALLTSSINSLTSFLCGLCVFSILGYMAKRTQKQVADVAQEGPGLVFVVYPEALATMPGSTYWSILFFLMLLTIGLDSSFGGSESIITSLSDEYPLLKRHRELLVFALFFFYFLVPGLPCCTQGGMYLVNLLDGYAANYSILTAVILEAICVSWIYGVDRVSEDIYEMLGHRPGIYWRVCWKYIAPFFLVFISVFGLLNYAPLEVGGYKYPWWANVVGWLIAVSSMFCMPAFAIAAMLRTPGTFKQRLKILTTPWRDQHESHFRDHPSRYPRLLDEKKAKAGETTLNNHIS